MLKKIMFLKICVYIFLLSIVKVVKIPLRMQCIKHTMTLLSNSTSEKIKGNVPLLKVT